VKGIRLAFVATLAAFALVAYAQAPNVLGKWTGKMEVDMSSMPKPKNDQEKQMMDSMVKMTKDIRFVLTLNRDKTYTIDISGVPAGPNGQKPPQDKGKWVQAGEKITLTPEKRPNQQGTPPTVTITAARDGKKMTMQLPGGGPRGNVVFTK
jgi:hypothetical protein